MNLHRLNTLIGKERKQLFRDPSSIIFGILLPILLLLIFGYGLSMDIRNIRLAVVLPEDSGIGMEILTRFQASQYFKVMRINSSREGMEAVKNHQADACLFLPQNLPKKLSGPAQPMEILIVVNATNAMQGRLTENYIKGVLATTLASHQTASQQNMLTMNSRMWFNESNDSRLYLLPGVIVIIMSIIGTKLTSMIMAKEYEHGNLESMFVTPMTSGELLLAKALNNFILGLIGLGISLIIAHFLFGLPIRGSLSILILGTSFYLMMALAVGLVISSLTKSQFVASEVSLILSFMPVFLLSGFLYEIPNMPVFVQYVTYLVPARYFVDFLQTIFLVGNVWSIILINLTIIALFTIVLMVLAKFFNPKSLGR